MRQFMATIRGFHGYITLEPNKVNGEREYIYGLLANGDTLRKMIIRGEVTNIGAYFTTYEYEDTYLYNPESYLYLFKTTLENGAEGVFSKFDLKNGFFFDGRASGRETIELIETVPDGKHNMKYRGEYDNIPVKDPIAGFDFRKHIETDRSGMLIFLSEKS